MMGKVYFVSGIDTDVGKSVVTGLMARYFRLRGIDAITVKMVQTGGEGSSEDIETHRAISGSGLLEEDKSGLSAPQIFRFPSSPLLAAKLENREVDLAKILHSVEECAAKHEIVLVEGAGGLAVPLVGETLTIDFIAQQGWPLLFVTCGRLGAINHIVLSLEAAASRKIPIAGFLHNYHPKAEPVIDEDTVNELAKHSFRLGYTAPILRIAALSSYGSEETPDFSCIFK